MHTAARFPESVCALGLLDGGYLVAQDDPDYNPDSDFEDELAELRRLADKGESWDASDDVIAAAMVGSRREPRTPLYPGLRASGIPVLLAYATEPRTSKPCGRSPWTGSGTAFPTPGRFRSREPRTASSRTTLPRWSRRSCLALRARLAQRVLGEARPLHHVGELLVDDVPAPGTEAAVGVHLDALRVAEDLGGVDHAVADELGRLDEV